MEGNAYSGNVSLWELQVADEVDRTAEQYVEMEQYLTRSIIDVTSI